MPNFVKNKIIVGKKEYGKILVDKYSCYDTSSKLMFDFNKIIEMPNELEVEFSTKSNIGIGLYMTYINPNISYYGNESSKVCRDEYLTMLNKLNDKTLLLSNFVFSMQEIKTYLKKYDENELLNLGRIQIENIKKYDAINWYEWSIKNWSTKWNAEELEVSEDFKTISFQTPWSPAINVIIEMSKQNPKIKMAFLYSNEDIGYGVGYMLLQNGVIDFKGSFPDYSIDSYKLAFDLWGCSDEYIFDNEKMTYVHKDLN